MIHRTVASTRWSIFELSRSIYYVLDLHDLAAATRSSLLVAIILSRASLPHLTSQVTLRLPSSSYSRLNPPPSSLQLQCRSTHNPRIPQQLHREEMLAILEAPEIDHRSFSELDELSYGVQPAAENRVPIISLMHSERIVLAIGNSLK